MQYLTFVFLSNNPPFIYIYIYITYICTVCRCILSFVCDMIRTKRVIDQQYFITLLRVYMYNVLRLVLFMYSLIC